jgi:uncharacterized membrane protein
VIWCQRYDGGRSWYTALGHTEASFGEAAFLQQVLGGLETTAGVTPSETCGVEEAGDAELRLSVKPKRAAVKPGKRATFRATVRNVGESDAEDVQLCAKAPRKHATVVGKKCVSYKSLAGAAKNARFSVKAKRKAAGKKLRIVFTAKSPEAENVKTTATLKVKKR